MDFRYVRETVENLLPHWRKLSLISLEPLQTSLIEASFKFVSTYDITSILLQATEHFTSKLDKELQDVCAQIFYLRLLYYLVQRIIREKLENISDPIEQYLRSLYQFLESAPSNGTIDATHRFACSCMVRCAVQFQAVTNLSEYSHTLLDRIIQQSLWHFKDTKSLGRQEFLPFVVTCQLISEMLLPVNSCEKVSKFSSDLFPLAVNILLSEVPQERKLTITLILPCFFMECTKETRLERLEALWKKVINMLENEEPVVQDAYDLVCRFYDVYFGQEIYFDLRLEETFWKMIQQGLLHVDGLVQKRSTHLLKKALYTSQSSHSSASLHWTKFFYWDDSISSQLVKVWDTFFLIYETFSEFSLHLVQPVWSQLEQMQMTQNVNTGLHSSWIDILYQKSFCSPNPSVRKWVVFNILENSKNFKYDQQFILGPLLMKALTDTLLYKGNLGSTTTEMLSNFFTQFANRLSDQDRISFLQTLIQHTVSSSNIPRDTLEAVLYLTSVTILLSSSFLSKWGESTVVDSTSLNHFASYFELQLPFVHNTVRYRMYALIIAVVSRLSDYEHLTFDDILKFVHYLPDSEITVGSENWSKLSKWFSGFDAQHKTDWMLNNVLQHIQAHLKASTLAGEVGAYELEQYQRRALQIERVLSFVRTPSIVHAALEPLYDILGKVYSHTYMPTGYPEKALALLATILTSKGLSQGNRVLTECIPEISSYVNEKIRLQLDHSSSDPAWNVECIKIYMSAIGGCMSLLPMSEELQAFQKKLLQHIITKLETISPSEISQPLEALKFTATQCLYTLSRFLPSSSSIPSPLLELLNQALVKLLPLSMHNPEKFTEKLDPIQRDAWKKYVFDFSVAKWQCAKNLLSLLSTSGAKITNFDAIYEECTESLSVSTAEYMASILDCMRVILACMVLMGTSNQEEKVLKVTKALEVAWRSVLDKRTIPLIASFISVAFQPALLHAKYLSCDKDAPIKKCFYWVLAKGEAIPVITNCMAFYWSQFWKDARNVEVTKHHVDEIIALCLFNPDRKGQYSETEDVEYEILVEHYIEYLHLIVPSNDNYVRVAALTTVMQLHDNVGNNGKAFVHQLMIKLLDKELSWAQKVAYRCYSAQHRLETRLWQLLCLCANYIHEMDDKEQLEMNKRIWSVMIQHNHKTVRYYIELFTIHFLVRAPQYIDPYLLSLLDQINHRSDVIQSVVSIGGFLLVLVTEDKCTRAVLKKLLQKVMLYLNTHHLGIRRTAQAVVSKLVDYWQSRQPEYVPLMYPKLFSYFLLQDDYLKALFQYFHENKECAKFLLYSPPFLSLDPLSDCTVEGLLWKLADDESFPQTEAIHPELFKVLATNSVAHNKPYPTAHKHITPSEEESKAVVPPSEHSEDFQKKVIPWSQLEYEETKYRDTWLTTKPRQDIIIVASLLDKIPNLAGLTRTCEIFSANSLVLASKKVLSTGIFQEIAVTADKWVPIIEVAVEELVTYLQQMKNDGYVLLGVEQTSNSKNIVSYTFPSKCLLLLGKEKEGIPAEFIQLLDECIHVPQLGVIRSLNVHVAGSIFLYEYTRQQLLNNL